MNKIKAVIFDRDGVIVDSEPINLDSAIKAFKQQGIEITDQEKKIIIGTHPVDYQKVFEQKYDGFDFIKYRQYKVEIYLHGLRKAELFQETLDLIKELEQKNITMALVTSSLRDSTLEVVKRAGLDNIFQTIITFEDCDERKPAPDCYLLAAERLNINPQECLVFEDSGVGVQAAKKAGMTCYATPNPITADQDFSLADKIIKDKAGLSIELLESLL